jgi:hypothetical protein
VWGALRRGEAETASYTTRRDAAPLAGTGVQVSIEHTLTEGGIARNSGQGAELEPDADEDVVVQVEREVCIQELPCGRVDQVGPAVKKL